MMKREYARDVHIWLWNNLLILHDVSHVIDIIDLYKWSLFLISLIVL